MIDTGSSMIVLEPNTYDSVMGALTSLLHDCVSVLDGSMVSCTCPSQRHFSKLPSLVINVIDESDTQVPLCMSPLEYMVESMDTLDGSICVPALQRGSWDQPVPIILGNSFMRAFYTHFDLANSRIGFARSLQSPMGADAQCSVAERARLRRSLWVAAVTLATISVIFMCHVLCMQKRVESWDE